MIYACEDCGFIFKRIGEVSECPSCEQKQIRHATAKEQGSLLKYLEQYNRNAIDLPRVKIEV